MAVSIGSQSPQQNTWPTDFSVGPNPPSSTFTASPGYNPSTSTASPGYTSPLPEFTSATSEASTSLPEGFTQNDLADLLASNGGDITAAAGALGMSPDELLSIAMSGGLMGG